jgi:hypothetical protein
MLTLAILFNWSVFELMLSFVAQNIILGFFYVLRILNVGVNIVEYKTFSANIIKKIELMALSILLALFFVLHYGLINWLYMVLVITGINVLSWTLFIIPVFLFIMPHLILYREKINKNREEYEFKDIKRFMLIPYARIIPMNVIMLPALLFKDTMFTIIIFTLLKTAVDVRMNKAERKLNNITEHDCDQKKENKKKDKYIEWTTFSER